MNMRIKELTGHILKLDLQREPARLAFYNFLMNFCRIEDDFDAASLRSFFERSMLYQQWQSSPNDLQQQVFDDLAKIAESNIELKSILDARNTFQKQWVNIENDADFDRLLEDENQLFEQAGEQIKMFKFSNQDRLRLRWIPSKSNLKVEVKVPMAFIDGVRLRLIRPSTELLYNSELELLENSPQILQLSPLKYARFFSDGIEIKGHILQGASFAKIDTFADDASALAEVFWPLKNIEKYFVNPITDSDYHVILADLERAIQAVKKFHPNAQLIATEALKQGQIYQQNVFPHDKVLKNLISTLSYHLRRDDAVEREICQNPLPPSV